MRPLRWFDAITVNIYFFGLTTLSQTMTPLVIPLLVQHFVGIDQQNSYYGNLRLWSLMVALIIQSFMGLLSDHSKAKYGRRRPYIFWGTIINILIITAIGFTSNLSGTDGYWLLFILVIFLMIGSNTAQAGAQGLIPDIVQPEARGVFSGVKALFEVPLPLVLVALVIGPLIASDLIWVALISVIAVLLFTMIISMLAPEKKIQENTNKMNWEPLARLIAMTLAFTGVILFAGEFVKRMSSFVRNTNDIVMICVMGLAGFIAMLLTIAIGTITSVRIGTGKSDRSNMSFSWWVVNRLAFLVGATNLASFAVYFFQGRLGLQINEAAEPASKLILYIGICILLMALPSGWLSDKLNPKPLVITSGIIATIGTIILLISTKMVLIFIGGILIGAATGVFYSSNWALGTKLVPKLDAGRYLGISNLAGAGAGAVGAYIGGPIADFLNNSLPDFSGIGYLIIFSIYGGMFLLSCIAATQIKNQINELHASDISNI